MVSNAKKNKVEHICTICGDSFMSRGNPARHACAGEFNGKTGTGIPAGEIPEIPIMEEESIEIVVE